MEGAARDRAAATAARERAPVPVAVADDQRVTEREAPLRRAAGRAAALGAAVVPAALRSRRAAAHARREALGWEPSALAPQRCGPLAARLAAPPAQVPPGPATAAPAVVLLHGLAASGAVWGRGWDGLAAAGPLVIPDLLGFGLSPRPRHGYTAEQHAEAIAACLDAAGVTSPAILVGHSFGALVALSLARRDPGRAAGLVLLSPPLHRSAGAARRRMYRALSRVERVIATENVVAHTLCVSICTGRPRLAARLAVALRPELPVHVAREGVLHSWESYSESFADLLAATTRPEWAAEAGVPVRLVAGGRDRCLDLELLTELAAASPRVELHVAPARGHLLPIEDAPLCTGVVEAVRAAAASASAPAAASAPVAAQPRRPAPHDAPSVPGIRWEAIDAQLPAR